MIFSPGKIGAMDLRNRLVRSATYENMAGPDGSVTDDLVELYSILAGGGVGLIITGHAFIREDGRNSMAMLGINNDRMIAGLSRITQAVHDCDGKIAAQINHAGRQANSALTKQPLIAPSEVPERGGKERPIALSKKEISQLVDDFVEAIRRAYDAGFDAVQLHAAHGFIINQFLSPHTNRREDEYGGSLEKRCAVLVDIKVRAAMKVPPEFPIFLKLNGDDGLPKGITPREAANIAQIAAGCGYAAIEVSGGMRETGGYFSIRMDIDQESKEAYFRDSARVIKDRIPDVPVILVGGLRSYERCGQLLEIGNADFLSMARPFIREPDLPNRWMSGVTRRADCISCNLCVKHAYQGSLSCRLLSEE